MKTLLKFLKYRVHFLLTIYNQAGLCKMPTLNVSTAPFVKVSWMPTSLKILCKYRYSQKSGYRITTTKDHMNHWEEKHQWNTTPCRRHVINRSTLKKIDLLITTIFIFENSPGCQSENREGYNQVWFQSLQAEIERRKALMN